MHALEASSYCVGSERYCERTLSTHGPLRYGTAPWRNIRAPFAKSQQNSIGREIRIPRFVPDGAK